MENFFDNKSAVLVFEDGTVLKGSAIGYRGTSFGEICFNTGMTGYQEIFTDPSYFGQIITMSNVHIGNYGTSLADNQSSKVQIAGLIVNNFSESYSRELADQSLQDFLVNNEIVGIQGLDTRALIKSIRAKGVMNVVIDSTGKPYDILLEEVKRYPSMDGRELASLVTTQVPYDLGDDSASMRVAVIDFGCKSNILDCLVNRGVYVRVFPSFSTLEDINAFKPDGYFLSNGPGDPAAMKETVPLIQHLMDAGLPIFGICLGHQLLALAGGMKTRKMKYGHRGINQPVINLMTGLGEITSQNHGFEVDPSSIHSEKSEIVVTHRNLNDDSIEGIRWTNKPIFSVQYHPEAEPGPHDSRYLFDQFVENILTSKKSKTIQTIH